MSEPAWHFGHNCIHFIPTLRKCRLRIDQYIKRDDLITTKALTTRDFLLYTGRSQQELLEQIAAGAITLKRVQADGSLRYAVRTSWAWDGCPLTDTGGHCLDYSPHDAPKIRCIKDLENGEFEHPNTRRVPSDADVRAFDERALAVGQGQGG